MEKGKCEIREDLALECRSSPYFGEFQRFLGPGREFGSAEEDLYFFYCYRLSRKIQDTVFNTPGSFNPGEKPIFQEFYKGMMENEQIGKLLKILKTKSKRFKRNSPKDRKTSFFRMIVKRLKKISRRNIRQGSQNCMETLAQVQGKLSQNTISKEAVDELMSKCGPEIVEYLQSSQAYYDILNVNKSKVNKAFYLLHLRELSIEARNGRLSEYSFFLNCSWNDEVKNIAKVFFNERWQNNDDEMNKNHALVNVETDPSIRLDSENPKQSPSQTNPHEQPSKPAKQAKQGTQDITKPAPVFLEVNMQSWQDFNEESLFDILVLCSEVESNFQQPL